MELAPAMHFLTYKIQSEVGYPKRYFRLFRVTAAERAHPRQQFLHRKRLREIIIGAELETIDRDRSVRRARSGPAPGATFSWRAAGAGLRNPSMPGKPISSSEEIEGFCLDLTQGGFSIVNHDRIMARFRESGSDVPRKPDFVLNHKYAHWIGASGRR